MGPYMCRRWTVLFVCRLPVTGARKALFLNESVHTKVLDSQALVKFVNRNSVN